jgi:hypothetical protein
MKAALLAASLLLACVARAAPAQAQSPWTPFEWGARPGPGPAEAHAAILLAVTLDGIPCRMQLDSGAGASVLYRHELPAALPVDGDTLRQRVDVGGLARSHTFQLMYPDAPDLRQAGCRLQGDDGPVAGTIGNDLLLDSAIQLDLGHARFRILPGKTALAPSASAARQILPFTLDQAGDGVVPVLAARLPDGTPARLLFDTGSAGGHLLVFRQADWLALVGAEGAARADKLEGRAWGQPISCATAPSKGVVRIVDLELPAGVPAAYCTTAGKATWGENAEYGVLGLKPFAGRTLLIDYAARRLQIE